MTDFQDKHPQENEDKDFADLLKSYSPDRNEDLVVGDPISGEIIAIGGDKVFVDTGTKIDGFVKKADIINENGELNYKVGDILDLYVVAISENQIELSPGFSGVGGLMHLKEAYKGGIPVAGKVDSPCKGGFNVTVMEKRAFCPMSQMDIKYVENPEDFVGNTYFFLISQFEENGRNIVLSRRDILKKELEKSEDTFYKNIAVGDILEGQVTRIMPYGVFVELLPNIEGMIHVSELSWSKTAMPDDTVNVGDRVRVKLIGIERTDPSKKLKISLSIKQLTGDPWDTADGKFTMGDIKEGKVTRCTDFGAFVEIEPGIEGLIHISEMSYTKRVLKPEDVVHAGDLVSVMIKDVDLAKKRLSLSLRDAEGDPWLVAQNKYAIGTSVRGTVEKKESFGLFISLEPGITGLLPKSKMPKSYDAASIEKLKQGDTLMVMIEELNPQEKKMTLAPADSSDLENWQHYIEEGQSALGSLGEKLQAAMKRKNKEPRKTKSS